MKYFSLLLIIFVFTLNSNKSFAEDALTIKQQIDRIMEEVKDLNKAVFNKSFKNEQFSSDDEIKEWFPSFEFDKKLIDGIDPMSNYR